MPWSTPCRVDWVRSSPYHARVHGCCARLAPVSLGAAQGHTVTNGSGQEEAIADFKLTHDHWTTSPASDAYNPLFACDCAFVDQLIAAPILGLSALVELGCWTAPKAISFRRPLRPARRPSDPVFWVGAIVKLRNIVISSHQALNMFLGELNLLELSGVRAEANGAKSGALRTTHQKSRRVDTGYPFRMRDIARLPPRLIAYTAPVGCVMTLSSAD